MSVTDAAGHATSITTGPTASYTNATRSAELVAIGSDLIGLVTDPTAGPYTVTLQPTVDTTIDLAVALPRSDGSVARADTGALQIPAGRTTRVVLDTAQSDALRVEQDLAGDGEFTATATLTSQTFTAEGASLVSATVVGPEVVAGASSRGFSLALLFDRQVKVEDDQLRRSRITRFRRTQWSTRRPNCPAAGVRDARAARRPLRAHDSGGRRHRRSARRPWSAATAPMHTRLVDAGAVITGHVMNADGSPIQNAPVVYADWRSPTGAVLRWSKPTRGQFGFRTSSTPRRRAAVVRHRPGAVDR